MLNLLDWLKIPIGDATFYAIFGFLFVFLGIVVLILIFTLLGLVMKKINTRKAKPKKAKSQEKERVPVEAQPILQAESTEIPPEVIAVITAAIAACLESENATCDFVVRRIKRIEKANG